MKDKALAEWNSKQPAHTPVLRYEQLTPAQQSLVDQRAEELEQNPQYTGNMMFAINTVVDSQLKTRR